MKDLIEALNRAHQLDEAHKALNRDDVYQYLFKLLQDDDMNHFIFTTCKNIAKKYKIDVSPYWPLDKILDRFTDKQLAEVLQTVENHSDISADDQREESWTDYAARRLDEDPEDFLDEMFAKFVEEAYTLVEAEGYTDVFTEPSTQAGRGGDFFWAEKDGVSYQGNYDFETEQEEIGDCCLNAESEEEAIELCAKKYASIILSSLEPDLEEDLNRTHKLDEATTSVRVPAAIREYVDAYCDAINNMKGYNEDLWDRGTGGMFFMYSKPSSAYADRVMRAVGENYSLTKEQVKAVYEYVEFQEPADWYDDPSVKNEFVSLEINKSSEQFSTYKQYLSNLCRELKKKYQIVMFRKNNVGTAQQDSVTAVVECQRGSYVPLLTIKLDSAYGKKLEGQKLTSDVSKDADIISKLMLKHVNTNKAFWISYDEFIKQITSVVNSTRYMRLDETSTGRRVTIEYSDGREKNHNLSLNPDLVVIDPNVDNDVAGATVYFITPEKSSFNIGPYEFSASMWSKNKRESNYESSELNTAVQDIKSFLTSYDTPTAQWGRISQNESIKKLNTVDTEDTMEALNRADELDEAAFSSGMAGDYRALLKMGLQESSTSIDVFAEAKNRMPFVTSTSGTNENFEIVFEDDLTGDTFYIRGKLVDNRYNVQVEVHENRRSLWGYRTSVHFWNMNPLAPKSLCTLFDRWDRAYLASGQTSGHMRLGPVFKGWNASLRLSHDS